MPSPPPIVSAPVFVLVDEAVLEICTLPAASTGRIPDPCTTKEPSIVAEP